MNINFQLNLQYRYFISNRKKYFTYLFSTKMTKEFCNYLGIIRNEFFQNVDILTPNEFEKLNGSDPIVKTKIIWRA